MGLDLGPFKGKSISIHWELIYTRPVFTTSTIARQHALLRRAAGMVDRGDLKPTLTRRIDGINAASLSQAHSLVEAGNMIGKVVVANPWSHNKNEYANDSKTIDIKAISLEAAEALLAQARRACEERGFAATIAITDAGGHLRAFERADNAPFLTVEVAIDKAWTAASFGMATHQWNQYMADPAIAPLAHHPRLMPVGGGVPVFHEGKLVGGIGISGGTSMQDHEAAEEALREAGFLQ